MTSFVPDGLALDRGAIWPAIRRDKTGAIKGLVRGKTEPAAVGTYRFAAP